MKPSCATKKKQWQRNKKEETMMKKKRIRKPTKTISVHTQKMANTNLKKNYDTVTP